MRVALTGVAHWHLPLYLDPLLARGDVEVVGMSDPDAARADAAAARAGTAAFNDWRRLIDETRPDLVFVLGRHIDMAEVCRGLITRGIRFAVEKPAGRDATEVGALAAFAEQHAAFAAVPFVFRQSRMLERIDELAGDDPVLYASFKFVAGSIDRYRDGSEWMLDRALSGGGCLLNLGVHFLDLARVWLGPTVHVAGAMASSNLDGLAVEDHAVVLLRGDRGSCLIETGYLYPAPHLSFDLHFSVRTARHHFAARDDRGLEIIAVGDEPRFEPMPVSNVDYYPVFVNDLVDRVASGRSPLAGLGEMAAVMTLVEAAYAVAGRDGPGEDSGR